MDDTNRKELLSAVEAARRLHLSDRRVRQLAKEGRIPSTRVNNRLRFRPEDIREYARPSGRHVSLSRRPVPLDRHEQDLLEFARRLRDELSPASVSGVLLSRSPESVQEQAAHLWVPPRERADAPGREPPASIPLRADLRRDRRFPLLQAHVGQRATCWQLLEELQHTYRRLMQRSMDAANLVAADLEKSLGPSMTAEERWTAAQGMLTGGLLMARGVDWEPPRWRQVHEGGQQKVMLRLGHWFITRENRTKLEHLLAIFDQVRESTVGAQVNSLIETEKALAAAAAAFRETLMPDYRLEDMIAFGACPSCPRV